MKTLSLHYKITISNYYFTMVRFYKDISDAIAFNKGFLLIIKHSVQKETHVLLMKKEKNQ